MSRKESRELVEAMKREASNRKKQKQENTRDSIARNLNRLAQQEQHLKINVQNLTWNQRRLETETRAMEVKKARIEQSMTQRTLTPGTLVKKTTTTKTVTPGPDVLYRSFPSPASTLDDPISPSACSSRTSSNPLPLPSSYEPFLSIQETSSRPSKTPRPTPTTVQHQPYIPQYIFPPQYIPIYIPAPIGPISSTSSKATESIKSFQEKSGAYWRRLKIALIQKNLRGKRKIQNPEDNVWFEYKSQAEGLYRIRLNGEWYDINDGCTQ